MHKDELQLELARSRLGLIWVLAASAILVIAWWITPMPVVARWVGMPLVLLLVGQELHRCLCAPVTAIRYTAAGWSTRARGDTDWRVAPGMQLCQATPLFLVVSIRHAHCDKNAPLVIWRDCLSSAQWGRLRALLAH